MASRTIWSDPESGVEVRWDKGEPLPYSVQPSGRRYAAQDFALRAGKRAARNLRRKDSA